MYAVPSVKHAAGFWLMTNECMFALHCYGYEQKQQSITAQASCSTLQIGPVLWCSAAYQYKCSTNQEMLSSIHNLHGFLAYRADQAALCRFK